MDARSSPDITHSAPLHDGRAGTLFVLINLNIVGCLHPGVLTEWNGGSEIRMSLFRRFISLSFGAPFSGPTKGKGETAARLADHWPGTALTSAERMRRLLNGTCL